MIYEREHSSLGARVFNIIREKIINGEYENGENLTEARLCEQYGVSRTPIREALRQLESEGLVRITPNKGAMVHGLTSQDIEDIYNVRLRIEGFAARMAAEKIEPEQLGELREAVELLEFYLQKGNTNQLQQLDSRFHEIIYNASRSRPLISVLMSLHNFIQNATAISQGDPQRLQKALSEHKAILEAIADKNPDLAEHLACKHVKNAMEYYSLKTGGGTDGNS